MVWYDKLGACLTSNPNGTQTPLMEPYSCRRGAHVNDNEDPEPEHASYRQQYGE